MDVVRADTGEVIGTVKDGYTVHPESPPPRAEILTAHKVRALAAIIAGCDAGRKAGWLTEDGSVAWGIMRHLVTGPDRMGFLTEADDVRDCYVRITTSTGFEWCPPMRELIARWEAAELSIGYVPVS